MVEQAAVGNSAFAGRQIISAEAKANRRLVQWSRINAEPAGLESESRKRSRQKEETEIEE
jgi:hypothetical protein